MSHCSVSYLGRCQQTGPHAGVQGRGARGRQGGAHVCVGITGGDDNIVRHTHIRCRSTGETGGQQRQGPSDCPHPRGKGWHWTQLTGMSHRPLTVPGWASCLPRSQECQEC